MRWQTLYEGRWVFVALLFLGVILYFLQPLLSLLSAILMLFSLWFFRDPERSVSPSAEDVVSPADGKITAVERMDDIPQGGTGWRISIFLSVFSVHVNRAPVAGKIESSVYTPGKFLDARHPESATKNESQTWIFAMKERPERVVVRQITGAIARRIVPWSKTGDEVAKGHRFGMIRFGSRTDLFLPAGVEPLVRPGQSVAGASTVVARWLPIEKP